MDSDLSSDLSLAAYDYRLPPECIAQTPAVPRDSSKLLVVQAQTKSDRIFRHLPEILRSGDLLVLNNTKVIPARLQGHKINQDGSLGAKAEVLLLEQQAPDQWLALVKPGRKLPPGRQIQFTPLNPEEQCLITAEILDRDPGTGGRLLRFTVSSGEALLTVIDRFGEMPLPPYIDERSSSPDQYQTVFAQHEGSAAAPTAGLHFTPELLERLAAAGIDRTFITLHVGVGTFRPVELEVITEHQMHGEWIEVNADTVAKIHQTQAQGGRVFAVGTTAARALEGAAQASDGELAPYCGKTAIFIYPGYQWRVIDGLITNFHLPKSSLMMMVSALIGRERLLSLYKSAIESGYRFFSFGDAMVILPEART
ncbi:MAG: tRNA preQ1(34) S-adenosylmethionine ribosyltransferase-isomerase QueA [Alkalinema sp. RU_4_3]|nr:tRNA preQ1(34) S-adenosylmethionine ribosyltransferase-isomerase QueA [Alkalinema sp. RU_4_3]